MTNVSAEQKAPESPGTQSKCALKVLTLEEKISVIGAMENGLSHKSVTLKFDCGRTQVNLT